MNKILTITTLLLFTFTLQAQKSAEWHTSFDKAAKISIETGKPILANFTGSDWCGWCKKLTKEVFIRPIFSEWAAENVVLLELDYPRGKAQSEEIKKQNRELGQFFKVRGYPTLHVFKVGVEEGKTQITQLGKTGYVAGGPKSWIASIAQYIN
jgi:protein disulfide-isomerase